MITMSQRLSLVSLAMLGASALPLAMACAERPGKPKVEAEGSEDEKANKGGKAAADAKTADPKPAEDAQPADAEPAEPKAPTNAKPED